MHERTLLASALETTLERAERAEALVDGMRAYDATRPAADTDTDTDTGSDDPEPVAEAEQKRGPGRPKKTAAA